MFYLKLFIGVLLGAILVTSLWTGSKPKQMEVVLNIGAQSGYPPFEFLNPQGKIVGFDMDLAAHIAAKLNRKLVIKDMEFDALILSLQQKKIDLILSGMNITPSRMKEIHMVPYIGEEAKSLSLLFWKKIPEGVHTLQDLIHMPDATVAVEMGAVPETYLKKYPSLQVKALHGAMEPLMDVKMGKSTANLVEPDVASYLKAKYPEIQIVTVPLTSEDQIGGFGIGIKKDNGELIQKVESIIKELKESGEMKQIAQKWFKEGS